MPWTSKNHHVHWKPKDHLESKLASYHPKKWWELCLALPLVLQWAFPSTVCSSRFKAKFCSQRGLVVLWSPALCAHKVQAICHSCFRAKSQQPCKGEKACAGIHSSCCILTLLFCCCMQSNVFPPFQDFSTNSYRVGSCCSFCGADLVCQALLWQGSILPFSFLAQTFHFHGFHNAMCFHQSNNFFLVLTEKVQAVGICQRVTTYTQAMPSGHTTLSDFNLTIFIFIQLCRLFRIQICKSRRGLRRFISRHCCYICSLEAKSTATMLVSPTCDKTFFVKSCRQSNTATLPICIFSPQPWCMPQKLSKKTCAFAGWGASLWAPL